MSDNNCYILYLSFLIFLLKNSNGGSDKQAMDSSSDSEMESPTMMHHSSNNNKSHSHSNSNNNNISDSHGIVPGSQLSTQMHLSAANAASHHASQLGSAGSLIQASQNSSSSSSSKNLGQISSSAALSAVAYSHLHSVMGNMPIYDMGDYQHL